MWWATRRPDCCFAFVSTSRAVHLYRHRFYRHRFNDELTSCTTILIVLCFFPGCILDWLRSSGGIVTVSGFAARWCMAAEHTLGFNQSAHCLPTSGLGLYSKVASRTGFRLCFSLFVGSVSYDASLLRFPLWPDDQSVNLC